MTFVNSGQPGTTDPSVVNSYFHFLNGRWGNGVAIREGGSGSPPDSGPVTTFA